MAFDFPSAPTVGDIHTEAGVEYQYAGNGVWDLAGGGMMTDYVLKAGDTMTGALDVQSAPANGRISLVPGDTVNAPRIDWHNPDGTRKGFLGYAGPDQIQLNLDSATKLNIMGGGISFGTQLGANLDDIANGIEMYSGTNGMGIGTSTGGQFNFVLKNVAHAFNFRMGAATKLQIKDAGLYQTTVANDKNGYFIGDRYHGMYFHSNKTIFTEYHDNFEWRKQTSGTTGGAGDLRMSLVGGALTIHAANHIHVATDGYGIKFNGNAHIYKKVGEGGLLREAGGDYRWAIEGNTGTWKGWISYQASATLSVEELIEERVAPLLASIVELKAEIAALKAKVK